MQTNTTHQLIGSLQQTYMKAAFLASSTIVYNKVKSDYPVLGLKLIVNNNEGVSLFQQQLTFNIKTNLYGTTNVICLIKTSFEAVALSTFKSLNIAQETGWSFRKKVHYDFLAGRTLPVYHFLRSIYAYYRSAPCSIYTHLIKTCYTWSAWSKL